LEKHAQINHSQDQEHLLRNKNTVNSCWHYTKQGTEGLQVN